MEKKTQHKASILLVLTLTSVLLYAMAVSSTPDSVTIDVVSNTTKTNSAGSIGNLTSGDVLTPNTAGGYIFTMNVSGSTQNVRWKAFIGNVSGTLTLDDANGFTIFDWQLSAVAGEIYSTRLSTIVNWTGIGCATTNMTEHENRLMNHTSADDNITTTFGAVTNKALTIGTIILQANSCKTLNIYENDTTLPLDDQFEQVVLNDFNNTLPFLESEGDFVGNIVYAQILEDGPLGYDNSSNYDFQIIVPEVGTDGFVSATAYYFYVELS